MASNAGTDRAIDVQEIFSKIEQILSNTNVIAVKLFGSCDADNENQTGRLPKVESETARAHTRLDTLEKKIIFYSGVASGILWIAEHLIRKLPL